MPIVDSIAIDSDQGSLLRDIGDTSKNFTDVIAMFRNLNQFKLVSELVDKSMVFAAVQKNYQRTLIEDPVNSEKLAVSP